MTKIDVGKLYEMIKDRPFEPTNSIFSENNIKDNQVRYLYKNSDKVFNVTLQTIIGLKPALERYEEDNGEMPSSDTVIDVDYIIELITKQPITYYEVVKISKKTDGRDLTLKAVRNLYLGNADVKNIRGETALKLSEIAKSLAKEGKL